MADAAKLDEVLVLSNRSSHGRTAGRRISMNWDVVGTMYVQLALRLEPRGQY